MKPLRLLAVWVAAVAPAGAAAQEVVRDRPPAFGSDVLFQTDADETQVVRAGVNLDVLYEGPEKYRGIRLEKAWFNPLDRGWQGEERVYLRAADALGDWKWAATVGTDGETVVGSATIHDEAAFRKELFVERDIIETPAGLDQGVYSTFAGAALDLPLDERNMLVLVTGLQEFTGDNLRVHLRANYVHGLKPEWGLSAQLRTRWFRNSDPREADYFSPRWYAQILPVLQLRRTTDKGWRYLLAGGLGLQRDSDSGWRRATYLNGQVTSPPVAKGWALTGNALFAETPTDGQGYRYVQVSLGMVRAF